MAARSAIEWTEASWNPVRARNLATGALGWHCVHVSEGCRNCYAEGFNRRLGTGEDYKPQLLGRAVEVFLDEVALQAPLKWKRPRKIFLGSMTDIFADFVTDEMLDAMFATMAMAKQHTFQILTKRPERACAYFAAGPGHRWLKHISARAFRLGQLADISRDAALGNVWLGTSAEDDQALQQRAHWILKTPAARHFLSAEPLLGSLSSLPMFLSGGLGARFDWVIAGGESGASARPMHPAWAREIRDCCAAYDVAYFFKQWGAWAPCSSNDGEWPIDRGAFIRLAVDGRRTGDGWPMQRVGKGSSGRLLDGRIHAEFPSLAA
ncbi:MAG: DUF5131 family protein [Caulobacteraceae bacterium]